ncbi:MAG TPA: lysylphosphatidylglycerol synthase transmembrane domain-containing protein [Anaerolineales bacterium]|nr:lysylphosphatidylglycerol synthase transmembrane domain-containing protein [Anaerolineales bacterium]
MSKNQSLQSFLKNFRWVVTLSAVVFTIWLLTEQDWGQIWEDVQRIGFSRFLLAFALMIGSRIFISLRWIFLVRGSEEKIPFGPALKICFAGLFSNNFMPSTVGGDVVRLAGVYQAGVSGGLGAASLVVDRLVGIAGMAAFLPFGLPILLAYESPAASSGLFSSPWLAFAAAPGGSLWRKLTQTVKGFLGKLFESIGFWLRRPKTLVLPFLATFAHMACLFGTIWVILTGLGEPITFLTVGGLWSMVYFVTLVPISVNGLGVQELSITYLYTTLVGVTEPHSLTLALLYRTMMMVASLPGALFLGGILRARDAAEETGQGLIE